MTVPVQDMRQSPCHIFKDNSPTGWCWIHGSDYLSLAIYKTPLLTFQ